MKKPAWLLRFLATTAFGREPVRYLLEYYSGDDFLTVTIQIPEDARERTDTLILPRSAPGAYLDASSWRSHAWAADCRGAILPAVPRIGSPQWGPCRVRPRTADGVWRTVRRAGPCRSTVSPSTIYHGDSMRAFSATTDNRQRKNRTAAVAGAR